jgi:mRNA-degrading endonuclease RelE of RelBE toxin-antitoxin system
MPLFITSPQARSAGDLIPETGGVRKVRWSTSRSGKRGGARVIYFFYDRNAPIYLLMVYSKKTQEIA